MKIAKNIKISQKILFDNKIRTILSLSVIIIGICSVIVLVSLGNGTEEKVTSQVTKMGTNLLIVSGSGKNYCRQGQTNKNGHDT